MLKLFSKLFYEGVWLCAYRKISKDEDLLSSNDVVVKKYTEIKVKRRYWCADPFIVTEQGRYFIFCEVMDRHKSKGMIGAYEIIEGKALYMHVLTELKCHTSYPCIFKYNYEWYMIPESIGNETVELYRADDFPRGWILDSVLLSGVKCVDTTVYQMGEELYVFLYYVGSSHEDRVLKIGKLDMENKKIEGIKDALSFSTETGRSAGNIIQINGKIIRPTQYCCQLYGEKIIYKEIVSLYPEYLERNHSELTSGQIEISSKHNMIGVHTINRCGEYEVIDLFYRRFFLCRPIEKILKKLRIGGYMEKARKIVNVKG